MTYGLQDHAHVEETQGTGSPGLADCHLLAIGMAKTLLGTGKDSFQGMRFCVQMGKSDNSSTSPSEAFEDSL